MTLGSRILVVLAVAAAAGALCSAAGAIHEIQKFPPSITVLTPGASYASRNDNCDYWSDAITQTSLFKSRQAWGRVALILKSGSWVASSNNTSAQTIVYTPWQYYHSVKKGYVKNTDTSSYYGQGYIDGDYVYCA